MNSILISMAVLATVILQWDRNDSADKVTGYNLYNNNVRFSNTTSNRIIMTNISTSKQYRFNVTAVNAFTESAYSNTVELLIPAAPVLKTIIKGQLEIQ